MKSLKFDRKPFKQQKGVAAIEFAIVLPILVLVLAVPLFLAFVCWHYSVAQKAAHDAARYLSLAPKTEMLAATGGEVEAAKFAKSIAELEVQELKAVFTPFVDVQCDGAICIGSASPAKVRVLVRMKMVDNFFPTVTEFLGTVDGFWLTADVSLPYVGH